MARPKVALSGSGASKLSTTTRALGPKKAASTALLSKKAASGGGTGAAVAGGKKAKRRNKKQRQKLKKAAAAKAAVEAVHLRIAATDDATATLSPLPSPEVAVQEGERDTPQLLTQRRRSRDRTHAAGDTASASLGEKDGGESGAAAAATARRRRGSSSTSRESLDSLQRMLDQGQRKSMGVLIVLATVLIFVRSCIRWSIYCIKLPNLLARAAFTRATYGCRAADAKRRLEAGKRAVQVALAAARAADKIAHAAQIVAVETEASMATRYKVDEAAAQRARGECVAHQKFFLLSKRFNYLFDTGGRLTCKTFSTHTHTHTHTRARVRALSFHQVRGSYWNARSNWCLQGPIRSGSPRDKACGTGGCCCRCTWRNLAVGRTTRRRCADVQRRERVRAPCRGVA